MSSIRLFLFFVFLGLNFSGCVTAPKVTAPVMPKTTAQATIHRVEKGQTLWRISRLYGMEVQELAGLNNIQDSAKLEIGQKLLIPAGRRPQVPMPGVTEEDFGWPIRGKVICAFGQPLNNTVNKGINIEPYRSLDVLASRSGKVAFFSEDFLDLGKTLILEHPEGFWTVYGRNLEVYVKPGDPINKGAIIAKAGNAGADNKVYLHFEVRKGSKSENPLFYLP
jgi:murein DD-endopeptidase MepM/ murein hydrolase activator NlpD